mmetsp:Transcript_19591/g.57104  ORF Transcript_19591/g.57104 Transcript_19591/m.57104 type:complete len:391 (+) Transcript_19591:217-1389(+)
MPAAGLRRSSQAGRRGDAGAEGVTVPTDPEKIRVGNLVDEILGGCNPNTAKGKAERESWRRAQHAHAGLRDKLTERGWRPKSTGPQHRPQDLSFTRQLPHSNTTAASVSLLFPGDWWRALSNEPLAALIVDNFASAFCDALLDGLVLALVEKEGWGLPAPNLRQSLSASAPALPGLPLSTRPRPHSLAPQPQAPMAGDAQGLSQHQGVAGLPYASVDLSPGAGMSPASFHRQGERASIDDLAAWTTCARFHASPKLDPYTRRVQHAVELQRPKRRLAIPASSVQEERDERKFCWPMSRSNFPDEWDGMTRRRQGTASGERLGSSRTDRRDAAPVAGDGPDFIIGTDHNGKTKFPYSLALHKAFLESQASPTLRSKARQIAPLKITTSSYY